MIDPNKLAKELVEAGNDWADKDAAFFLLDETKKDVLSECIGKLNDQDLSAVKAEQEARRLPQWRENQSKLAEARREMNRAKVRYTGLQTYIELIRSREATNRAEMNLT